MSDFCGIKWLERGPGNAYTPPPSTRPHPSGAATPEVEGGLRRRQREHGVMTDARWFEGAKLNFAHNLMPPPTDDEVRSPVFRVCLLVCLQCVQPSREFAARERVDIKPSVLSSTRDVQDSPRRRWWCVSS